MPLSLFERQLATLQKAGYTSVSLDEMRSHLLGGKPVNGKPIVITFDDGYESFATHALPALKRIWNEGNGFPRSQLRGAHKSMG